MPFIIHRKPPYRVYVEEGQGVAMSHVAELPGCFSVGSSAAMSVQGVPGAIARYLAWLRRHKEPLVPEAHIARPNMADLYVADVVRQPPPPTVAGDQAALFEFDKEPWSDDKLERTLRWFGYSRADLLLRIDGLSDNELKSRNIEPDRTMWDTLWHLANAEYGYIQLIVGPLNEEGVTRAEPSGVRERLQTMREIFLKHARSVPAEARNVVIFPAWASRPDEPWTLAKAIRRALEHEIEHLTEFGFRI